MINEVTASRQIERARSCYLATLEKQRRLLAEIPPDLDPLERLLAVDRILRDCSQALRTLAEQLPDREQTAALGPELSAAFEEFRESIDAVHQTITTGRRPILADIAALQPRHN